jgi:hypothetical protein
MRLLIALLVLLPALAHTASAQHWPHWAFGDWKILPLR